MDFNEFERLYPRDPLRGEPEIILHYMTNAFEIRATLIETKEPCADAVYNAAAADLARFLQERLRIGATDALSAFGLKDVAVDEVFEAAVDFMDSRYTFLRFRVIDWREPEVRFYADWKDREST